MNNWHIQGGWYQVGLHVENESDRIPDIAIELIGGVNDDYVSTEKIAQRIALLLNLFQGVSYADLEDRYKQK